MISAAPYTLVLEDLWPYGLVFARFVCAALLMPGLGDSPVNVKTRLLFTLGFSTCVTPILKENGLLPALNFSVLVMMHEAMVGFFLGTLIRFVFEILEVTGALISHQSALSNAFVHSVSSAQQASLPGALLGLSMMTMIFTNDMHHVIFEGIVGSYQSFPCNGFLPIADMTSTIFKTITQGFQVALQISGPFLIFGSAFFMIIGLLSRLMPQLQIFFIAQPFEIFLGFLIFIMALTNIVSTFFFFLSDFLFQFTGG